MNVLFTGFFPRFSIHFGSELDLAEKYLQAGDKVFFLTCDASLTTCECNPSHELSFCADCIGRRQDGLSLLSLPVRQLPLVKGGKVPDLIPAELSSPDKLRELSFENFDYGEGVLSSLVDQYSTPEPDIRANFDLIKDMASDAFRVWQQAQTVLKEHRIDRVYIFNGRFNTTRAWVRACQKWKVPFSTHDRFSALDRVVLIEGTIPHDPTSYPHLIEKSFNDNKDDPEQIPKGVEFFEERPRGKLSGWTSFISEQKPDALPDGWVQTRRNMAVFASSEREYVAVQNFTPKSLYPSQIEAYLDIFRKVLAIDPDIMFYLRIHPNSLEEGISWWDDDHFKDLPNLQVIPPGHKVSTYALLHAAEKVISYHSTVGLEATYWGKPSISLGWPIYKNINAVYEPDSPEDAVKMVLASLEAKPRENAVKFGSYMFYGGEPFKFSKPIDIYSLSFKGYALATSPKINKWSQEVSHRKPGTFMITKLRALSDWIRWWWYRISLRGWFAATKGKVS